MGINVGNLSGASITFLPFGGDDHLFQPELSIGALGRKVGFDQSDAYVGAGLRLDFTPRAGLVLMARKSVEANKDIKFTQALAGLTFAM